MKIKLFTIISGLLMISLLLTGCFDFTDIAEGVSQEEVEPVDEPEAQERPAVEEPDKEEIEEEENNPLGDLIHEPSSLALLVNKEYALDEDYKPDDLVTVDVPTVLENPEVKQLRKEPADKLKEMFESAKESNIVLHARSGYRSYNTQVQLFNSYASNHGEEAANKYSARPGQSEHQTGLAMDITSQSVNYQLSNSFGQVTEGIWVSENAHKFGFIIRYPEGKEEITGYQYEPWHLRYLGEDLATLVYESGLTYEEYLSDQGII